MMLNAMARPTALSVVALMILFGNSTEAAPPEPPELLFPEPGAVVDNGCREWCDPMERDFDWVDVPGAEKYEIYSIAGTAQNPAINDVVTDSSFSESSWAWTGALTGWTWKVRAWNEADGWGDWSESRPYDVEPLDTDCVEINRRPRACTPERTGYSGDAPFEVTFTAVVTDEDGVIVAYRWDFDDDGRFNTTVIGDPTITHVFTELGYHTVRLVAVDDDGGTVETASGVFVTGTPPAADHNLVIPAVAHAPGASDSRWRSDLTIINWSGADAELNLRFVPITDHAPAQITRTLEGGHEADWEDILVTGFGFADDDEVKGVVHIESPVPIIAQARTYNHSNAGSFGQVFPAVRFADGITGAEVGVIQGVRGGEGFRTNLGLVHLGGPTVCQATVEIAGPHGELIGEPVLMYVGKGKYTQRNRILRAAGVEETEHGFAVVRSDTEGCTLWAYGSIIDEGTGDAITAPLTGRP